jgi:hypothetical protein
MESSTCVVDGQQRLNAIREFVGGKFPVNGRLYSELSPSEKEDFLKYEVPVIDFDLDAGDENLKEVFKRLNRTFYSLSTIERIATEFSASQYLLVARVLSGDITATPSPIEIEVGEDFEVDDAQNNKFSRDPGINSDTWEWLIKHANGPYSDLITGNFVFSHYESQRKVPLMFVLNVMSTVLGGYYNRNTKVKEYLEIHNDEFERAEDIIDQMNSIGSFIADMRLPESSIWWNKANFFTMSVELIWAHGKLPTSNDVAKALVIFEENLPGEYALDAREAVNNKTQRANRGAFFQKAIGIADEGS